MTSKAFSRILKSSLEFLRFTLFPRILGNHFARAKYRGSVERSHESRTRKVAWVSGLPKGLGERRFSPETPDTQTTRKEKVGIGRKRVAWKLQSVKTVTGNNKCVSRFLVTIIRPNAPVSLVFQKQQNTSSNRRLYCIALGLSNEAPFSGSTAKVTVSGTTTFVCRNGPREHRLGLFALWTQWVRVQV